jgi:hypothetical protein
MRTATPWWASLAFGIGLLLFLFGERFFGHLAGPRFVLTGLGLLLIIGVAGARVWAMLGSAGARRRVERALVVCHAATLLALILYLLSTDWAMAKLNLSDTGAAHFHGAITVVYLAVLIGSLVPVLMAELSLGMALRTGFDVQPGPGNEDAGVEYFRVREIGWSGLSVGLALSFLMVTCQVANDRNVQRDVSYFKTSSPGESTQKIITTSSDPIKVLLFFPDPNAVKDQVKGYFDTLASETKKLGVEQHDRFADAELAGKYKVTKDGTIVFVRGTGDKEKSQLLDVDIDIAKARTSSSKLRNFDHEVNSLLLKLARDKRKAYLLTGHGEITDPDSLPAELKGRVPERKTTVFKRTLGDLNYEVKNLGLLDLSRDVPEDATIVIGMAPSAPLQPAEWAALARYLDRGGRLFLALDPKGEGSMGELEAKLALKMVPGDLTDEVQYLPQRGMMTDRRFVITNQFSAHASTTSLSRTSADRGLILIDAGAFEDIPYTGKPEGAPKKTITIRSMDTSFLDRNDNFAFDGSGAMPEKKQRWNIAAAVEGTKVGDKDGYRVLLFADVDLFADVLFQNMGRAAIGMISDKLLNDSIHWLGGDEAIVGDVVSEDDKAIQHTKNEDVVWFTLMIIGAPIIVLTLGLIGTSARRRRASRKSEVTK